MELYLNGEELPGSPFPADISAGPVLPASCTLEGPDLVGCLLGATCSFLVASRDAFSNLRGGSGDSFHVSNSISSVVAVQSQSGGLYKVGTELTTMIFAISGERSIRQFGSKPYLNEIRAQTHKMHFTSLQRRLCFWTVHLLAGSTSTLLFVTCRMGKVNDFLLRIWATSPPLKSN